MNDFNFQHKNIYQNQNNINNPQMNFNNNFNPNIIMNNNNIFSQNQNQMKSINEFNIQVEFKYEGRNIDIYSHVNDRVKEICQKFGIKVKKDIKNMQFLYDGKNLYLNQSISEIINNNDKKRKIMSIIAIDPEDKNSNNNNKNIVKAEHIICPLCKDSAMINFDNFKVKISNCKNMHISYLLFNEFEDSQKIDESEIICNDCKGTNKSITYQNKMYICATCKMNLCPLCKEKHDKNHNIINYEQKYYICELHSRLYNSFCNSCKKDICVLCESEHDKHDIISYSKILPKKDKLNISKNMLNNSLRELNDKILSIENTLNNIKGNLMIYYEIIENLINNYNNNNINYKILKNLYDFGQFDQQDIHKQINKIKHDLSDFLSKISLIHIQMNTKNEIKSTYLNNNIINNSMINNNNIPNQSNNNRPKSIYINDISNNYIISNFQPQNIYKSIYQSQPSPFEQKYIFPIKGLKNISNTYYMNSILQCLLHVSELTIYFIDEYPKDLNELSKINKNVPTRGDISRTYYNLVQGVKADPGIMANKKNKFNSWNNNNDSNDDSFVTKDFQITLGLHNPQFRNIQSNDSKDFILYLLRTLHQELNYLGNKNQILNYNPNPFDINDTYKYFSNKYNSNNFSKISQLFYGTNIIISICKKCNNKLYNYQKFELIYFGMFYYHNRNFNIMDGFKDNSKSYLLTGDKKILCKACNSFQEAESTCQILEPPNKLLISIDYGKNKKYQPSNIYFDEEIDITPFVASNLNMSFKYRIIGVCTHYGYSENAGYYETFCKHKELNVWYEFNDCSCNKCNKKDIYRGSPFLLLYEKIL